MKKTLLIDIGNVILDFDFSNYFSKIASLCQSTEKKIENDLEEFKLKIDTGLISPREYYEFIIADYSLNISYIEFSKIWSSIFKPKNKIHDEINYLKDNYSISIASDTDPIHFSYFLNTFEFMKYFEKYYLSYNMGSIKTEEKFFNQIIQLNNGSSNFILVDDKIDNCEAAKRCNLESIHFQTWEQAKRDIRILAYT